jgi:hypothetical protein
MIIAVLCVPLALAACDPIPPEIIKSGDYFKGQLTGELMGSYWADLHPENPPTVSIAYLLSDGIPKTAVFQLDGYDAKKNIGYKLVLLKDKEAWDESRAEGEMDAPDMNDAVLIQEAAARYKFPIIFMWAYQYQNQTGQRQIDKNSRKLVDDFRALMKTPELAEWAYAGMYSGEWIREGIEEMASHSFDINFSHSDLVMDITYGENKHAVFHLDGYDSVTGTGYKFVTAADEQEWNEQRAAGNLEAPDLSDSELIREAALENALKVLFIYVPEYWNLKVIEIVNQELYPAMWGPEVYKSLHSQTPTD